MIITLTSGLLYHRLAPPPLTKDGKSNIKSETGCVTQIQSPHTGNVDKEREKVPTLKGETRGVGTDVVRMRHRNFDREGIKFRKKKKNKEFTMSS